MSSDTTGALATPGAGMSTRYRAFGTPSAGTSSTLAGSASATPLTVPRSRATPVWASPGRGPATRTETGNAPPGAVANGTASVTVTLPSAIRRSRSAAARAGVKGVPEETAAVPARTTRGRVGRDTRRHAQQRGGGDHGAAEKGNGGDGTAQRLGGRARLAEGGAGPAVALRDEQPGAAQVTRHGLPQPIVVGLGGLGAGQHLVQAAPVGKQ